MIIFSDFDGTISNDDIMIQILLWNTSMEYMYSVEENIKNQKVDFNECMIQEFSKISYNFDYVMKKVLPKSKIIDKNFKHFYNTCLKKDIKFYIISAGFRRIINRLIPYFPNENIYANDVSFDYNGHWNVHIEQPYGHKTDTIQQIIKNDNYSGGKIIYIGDGTSDFDVVGNVDMLFAKKNSALEKYCKATNAPYIPFETFKDIKEHLGL